jgi:hypothetical protein
VLLPNDKCSRRSDNSSSADNGAADDAELLTWATCSLVAFIGNDFSRLAPVLIWLRENSGFVHRRFAFRAWWASLNASSWQLILKDLLKTRRHFSEIHTKAAPSMVRSHAAITAPENTWLLKITMQLAGISGCHRRNCTAAAPAANNANPMSAGKEIAAW